MDKLKWWVILFLFASQSLYALTTCHVSSSTDDNPGGVGNPGELRRCLNTMNEELNTTPDDHAIVFDFPMTIQLNGILPIINNSLNSVNITIGNSGSTPTVTIDGNSGAFSGFFIPMGNVTIQNMIFQNLTAKGGEGGNGISGGGGGMGAGGAIYVPTSFLNGSSPSVILKNVSINSCSAVGGNGGSYSNLALTGNEGGGGGGGFSGNGGSVTTTGITGGAGGGGFGGNGGDVAASAAATPGGGGGGGLGSRATIAPFTNLGNGGSNANPGEDGNGDGLSITAGSGAGGNAGGSSAGGGGGGDDAVASGGGGGGSNGSNGLTPQGNTPPIHKRVSDPSGGQGGDGAGGGGGGVVTTAPTNNVDGQPGRGGYAGGGGGGAGTGAYDTDYSVRGGLGGTGGGGGGGGVNQSGSTSGDGGDSDAGGGGGGGGPSNGTISQGGSDVGSLGGGQGGQGANSVGAGTGGGGGGGGSGLGGAIFVDSNLNFTIEALTGVPTTFNTSNDTTQAGTGGTEGPDGEAGSPGTSLGNSIFLRTGSSLTFTATAANDLLTLGDQVAFTDDTSLGGGGTSVFVNGNGTIIYNGTTTYQGNITVNNATFEVNGQINQASVAVCRNSGFSAQRGTLSGTGILTGAVSANSGAISPDANSTLTVGSLNLNAASSGALGSLVHIDINSGGTSLVAVNGAATLAGVLEINLDSSAQPGTYTILTATSITGTFSSVTFTGTDGRTPNYTLSYLPNGAPTFVQFAFLGYPASNPDIPATVDGSPIVNPAVVCCGRPVLLGPLPVSGSGPTVYTVTNKTGNVTCQIGQTKTQTFLRMRGKPGSCTIVGTKNGVVSNPLTVVAS